jgi:peptidoglycan/LPS O-acetylase OafA/YrhL
MRVLGKYSYAVYLLHPFLMAPLAKMWARLPHTLLTGLALFGAVVVASLGLALVSWYALEQPALALKRHFRSTSPAMSPVLE